MDIHHFSAVFFKAVFLEKKKFCRFCLSGWNLAGICILRIHDLHSWFLCTFGRPGVSKIQKHVFCVLLQLADS